MSIFKEIKQTKPADEVYYQIKEAIFSHHYKANEKLPSEKELVEIFKVSRSAIREALKALRLNGFTSVKQGVTGGTFVNELTFERLSSSCLDLFFANKLSLTEICDARIAIEPITTEMAVKNLTSEDIKLFKKAISEENKNGEYPEIVVYRSKLHYLLAERCGNKFLEAMVKSMIVITKQISEEFFPLADAVHPLGMHDKILVALIDKNGEIAADAMKDHLLKFKYNMDMAEEDFRKKSNP